MGIEAASGFSQLAKVLCQFKHRTLAPTLLQDPTEAWQRQWRHSPFRTLKCARIWPSHEPFPQRCLITSFGAGGTSAALIVENFTAQDKVSVAKRATPERQQNTPYLFLLSARTESQLAAQVSLLFLHLHVNLSGDQKNNRDNLDSIAYTLQLGRNAMRYRLAIIADSEVQLLKQLESYQWREDCFKSPGYAG